MICAKELWLWLLLMGFPGSSTGKESTCSVGNWFSSWVRKIYWRRDRLPTPVFWPGEFHGLYIYIVHEVSKSQTWLSDSLSLITHVLLSLPMWGTHVETSAEGYTNICSCNYPINWRNSTKREFNLKWQNLGSFDMLKLTFLHAQLEKTNCASTAF